MNLSFKVAGVERKCLTSPHAKTCNTLFCSLQNTDLEMLPSCWWRSGVKKNEATYTRGRSCLLRSKKENAKLLQLGNRRRDLNFFFLKGEKERKKGKKQKQKPKKKKTSLHAHSHRRYKVKKEEGEERMRWTGSKGIFSIEEFQLRGWRVATHQDSNRCHPIMITPIP